MKRLWVVLLALGLAVQTGQAGTLNLQVGASADDADELSTGGTVVLTYNYLNIGSWSGVNHCIGLRFPGVSGLAGQTITAATLTFKAQGASSGEMTGDWYAQDTAAPGVFTTTAYSITSRTRTTATCEGDGVDFGNWANDGIYTFTGDGVNTIVNIIQELADSYNPSAIVLLWIYASGDYQIRTSDSFDEGSGNGPKLDITYSAGASGPSNITSVAGAGTITGWCGTSWSNLTKWCRP